MKRGTLESRRGSALLIVLGMFSFMLVSAVAFSIYMRASRAPSSYVRRNSVARQLAKAALARAMDEIDCAIGNDPFPGVGFNHDYGASGLNDEDKHKNDNWHGRVFTPSNEVAEAKTVSTLTLEALGYLPPCLIDEVRYWSRHTRTAKWHSFNYGAGQFAFTAVNVSDFFDINQFRNEESGERRPYLNRNSSPHGRISPTYLFRGNFKGNMDSGGAAASAFLNAVADGSGLNMNPPISEVPFVSMMDFNLALGGTALGGIVSPFYNRINGGTGRFYSDENSVRRQVFMAGGWNSDSNLAYSAYNTLGRVNLRYPEYQPFSGYSWFPDATSLSHCYNDVSDGHPFWQPFNENFPVLATALLCDYLDYDNVPLSLCIPCTEAVPMLCGVELNPDCVRYKITMVEETISEANAEQGTKKKIKRTYAIHIEVNGMETTLTAVYPFLNGPQGQASGYTAETFARVFFAEETNLGDSDLRDEGLRVSLPEFNLGNTFTWDINNDNNGTAFIQVKGSSMAVAAKETSGSGEAAEQGAIQGDIAIRGMGTVVKDAMLATLVYEVDESGNETIVENECVNGTDINFFNRTWGIVNFLDEIKNDQHPDMKFRPSVAVWARIKEDGTGKTVDMVPAIPDYDNLLMQPLNGGLNGFNRAAGGNAGTPLLRFFAKTADDVTGIRLTKQYFKDNHDQERVAQWKQNAYIANDPRINWAPEHWWATDQATDPKQLWFENAKKFRENNSFADADVFMSVSDQGYLQSMYEWMMIPQVRSLTTSTSAEWGAFENGNGYDGKVRAEEVNGYHVVLHNDLMWRTYRSDAFGIDSGWGSLDDLPFDEADNGLRVNPYTDIMNVMLGAFANMPRDWWAASTNNLAPGKNYMANQGSFEDTYLFDWSCEYADVYNMAYYWMGAFNRWDQPADEARGQKLFEHDNWKDVFENAIDWRLGEKRYNVPIVTSDADTIDTGILNETTVESILKDLTFAERKFLYGYLKGCFANNSQLFLVFVRAESAAGGGGAGSGARAVALVWRDPAAPKDASGQFIKAAGGTENPQYGKDNGSKYLHTNSGIAEEAWRMNKREYPPHKMRVLFYHQLD